MPLCWRHQTWEWIVKRGNEKQGLVSRICVYSGRVFVFTPVFVCARNAHVDARCFPFPAALECVVCFTSVGHKSPHCQPYPPKRVLQTLCQRIVICQNVIYRTLPGRQLPLHHNVNFTCPEWESHPSWNLDHNRICFWSHSVQTSNVSSFDDKNDFSSAPICNLWRRSVPDMFPLAPLLQQKSHSLVSQCFMISH